ncbi:glutamine amidotransferase class-II domain protein [Candidatus Caldarchaeum subterraneum]|uniref:Glutamine amidotransferase class-II domain protein n=1 Tax=Caldiarchaeum subterraneum TaxID=311458 RepID=E6N3J3_CALS0|nr:hypothetical conserved protein [Candidatus Caldarchaeum subterraneum]BAJ50452.1 glutamine amidotransferase class-II domain protein [Candidatus Caldarchaeum subterraneum]
MSMEPRREISACGILGILRKQDAEKVSVEEAVSSIECVRYRGSRLGAGFAAYSLDGNNGMHRLKIFIDSETTLSHVKKILKTRVNGGFYELGFDSLPASRFASWSAYVETSEETLRKLVDSINYELWNAGMRGRVYSWGRFVEVFKGVGYPLDVSQMYGLTEKNLEADMWIAHTRQPTNSPGVYPIWSHPFASQEWAIAHNGDISSFGANMEFIRFRGYRSFVGTDSELIAYLLDYLTNIQRLPILHAAQLLVSGFEDDLDKVDEYVRWRGAGLDGPFSVVAGYCDGEDIYMLALADRSKFRPLVVGYDEERIYVASEEAEIRQNSPEAVVWPVKPGGIFLASLKKGIIVSGRENITLYQPRIEKPPYPSRVVDAAGLDYRRVNKIVAELFAKGAEKVDVVNVNGHRYLGVNVPPGRFLNIYGTAGNCLANFNRGGVITVYGNAEDDVADAMVGGRVIIHGNAGDVLAQAFQAGEIFVRGSAGNRVAIQMREFREHKPYLIIGGRVDDYLGEYMAGGVVAVLGVDSFDSDECLVGRCVATGMVGGVIYIRGRVDRWRIGLQPPREDVKRYLRGLLLEGQIDQQTYTKLSTLKKITIQDLRENLPPEPFKRISKLYTSKYYREHLVSYRRLGETDLKLLSDALQSFCREFGLGRDVYERLLEEKYTVIRVAGGFSDLLPEEG